MNRLTKVVSMHNNEPEFYETNIDLYPKMMGYEYQQAEMDCINKLGQLEDIEEELGIDLIKAIELCKQVNSKKVVYTKENWGIDTLKIIDELDIELFSHRLYKNAYGIYVSLDLYEYGKTWALTRKELEENAE